MEKGLPKSAVTQGDRRMNAKGAALFRGAFQARISVTSFATGLHNYPSAETGAQGKRRMVS
jgi:hypothetical protein